MAEPTHTIEYTSECMVTELQSGEQYLLVTITMTCPACGTIKMQLPGHHLRGLTRMLQEYIDQFPTLCYSDNELRVISGLMDPKGSTH